MSTGTGPWELTPLGRFLLFVLGLLVAVALVVGGHVFGQTVSHYRYRAGWILPDTLLTPGAVRTSNRRAICTQATPALRHTTASTKTKVYAEYGIATHRIGDYEIDHLIPLEMGGKDTITDLWPEPAIPLPGFHQKDILENFLHAQICAGILTADSAQRWIVHDLPGAYQAMVEFKNRE